ncbi:tetratricopeptide repeat protein [Synechococcus sp. BS55D]|uniref:tetratricopeptide repeat protein n=1 Tax=Synechococcus sp. BS55D TaxID=2055943 RepID=UPI00103E88F8|nr:tetratricopeptide repeat protein [Synechococcus sp. BS55D]TCD58126.1 hypothetical protein CWE16_02160 [Synechococcus sp. BS55D]
MSSIASELLTDPVKASYGAEEGWLRCFERLGQGELKPEQAIGIAAKAMDAEAALPWAMPLALGLWMTKRHAEGLAALQRPGVEEACGHMAYYHTLVGMVARQLDGQYELACRAYRQALQIEPNRHDTLYNLANLIKDEHPEEADQLYRRSLLINPNSASTWHNLGVNLNALNRPLDAMNSLRWSLCIDALNPEVWCNLGLSYYAAEDFSKAEKCFRHTISLDSRHSPGYQNLGNTLINVLKAEEAIEILEKGLELDPSSTHSLWNLSLAYLLLGRYKEGWRYYEARFNCPDFDDVTPPTAGSALQALSEAPRPGEGPLVVWSEQGMGDVVQFCRYLHLLEASDVPFVFLTRPCLVPLIRGWSGYGDRVQPFGSFERNADNRPHVALMSLPALFSTELHTVPASVPYLRTGQPCPEHLQLEPPPGGLNVGLVWASNPDNKAMYRNKSMPVAELMPLFVDMLSLGLIQLHSLQFGKDAEQLAPWLDYEGVSDWHHKLSDFSETAHLIRQMDLVISVDTAVAHLAGALNRPTWLLLPQNADFRWLKDRQDSPWYPSMRLFRQRQHGDWSSVVEQLHAAFCDLTLLDYRALASTLPSKP